MTYYVSRVATYYLAATSEIMIQGEMYMSIYSDRTAMSLHHMIREMYRKDIELARIVKCSVQMILSGVSANSIKDEILKKSKPYESLPRCKYPNAHYFCCTETGLGQFPLKDLHQMKVEFIREYRMSSKKRLTDKIIRCGTPYDYVFVQDSRKYR